MPSKKAIIIGAGVAGLATGYYLQQSGFETSIYELGFKPGGLCTSWERKEYIFDGSMQWLVGTKPKACYYGMWKELNAFLDEDIIDLDIVKVIEYKNDKFFNIYSDLNKLKEELIKISPEDRVHIEELIEDANKFSSSQIPVKKPMEIFMAMDFIQTIIENFGFLRLFNKYRKTNIGDFCAKFKSEDLKKIVIEILGKEVFPMINLIMFLGFINIKAVGFLKQGSSNLIQNLTQRYIEAGGIVNYGGRVKKIIVEDSTAKAIVVENDTIHEADLIVSTGDGFNTVFDLLGGSFLTPNIKSVFQSFPIYPPTIQVSAGIDFEFKDKQHLMSIRLSAPISTGENKKVETLTVQFLNPETGFAKEGKTTVIAQMETDFDYWKTLWITEPEKYKEEKEKVGLEVLKALNEKFGSISKNIETYDVATPMTYLKYTNNWKGSTRGWLLTLESLKTMMPRKLPGLNNFYMAGQWIEFGGGLHNVALSGRNIAQIICKDFEMTFKPLSEHMK